jgi:hypothetical protein
MRICSRTVPHWVAFAVMFVVLVIANVLKEGLGRSTPWRLAIAVALIAWCAWAVRQRALRYRALDELQQRVELESLATAFVGSFVVYVTYWLLQIAGLLPPLDGTYFVIVMVALRNMGVDGAWQQLLRRTPR